jgi:hypothetical protein
VRCDPSVLSHHALGRWNMMNHIASRGTIFGRSFVGVREFFLPWVIYCDESVIMTIYGFLNIQIICDVISGVGLCPYMGNVCVYGFIWERRRFLECINVPFPTTHEYVMFMVYKTRPFHVNDLSLIMVNIRFLT